MAIIVRRASSNDKGGMTLEEFKRWLMNFDANKDRRISREELQKAVRAATGGWLSGWKSKRGMKSADFDGNGFIDVDEVIYLKDFARKYLGIRIVDLRF